MRTLAVIALVFLLPICFAQTKQERVYTTDDGVDPPKLIHKVNPLYPDELRKEKISGGVKIKLEISRVGLPENLTILSSPHEKLSEAALTAVRQWRFEPATKEGEPVRVTADIEVNFNIK